MKFIASFFISHPFHTEVYGNRILQTIHILCCTKQHERDCKNQPYKMDNFVLRKREFKLVFKFKFYDCTFLSLT